MELINGYRIVLDKTSIKRISVESAINAGFIRETKETAGINHLLEHVLTEAWSKCGSSCSNFWTSRGVQMNASTDETIMMYYVKGLEDDLEEMVQYIAAITDHPIMRQKTLVDQKQAVIDELLTYGSDPTSKLDGVFNHLFFKNGLEYKDDWKLQIANLKRLTLADVQRVYKAEFTPANVAFVVSGDFAPKRVAALFRSALRQKGGVILAHDGFTFARQIAYVRDESMATSLVLLAMPSSVTPQEAVLLPLAAGVLGDVLFEELRTKRQLVYGARVTAVTTICGTCLQFKIYVRPQNLVECMRVLVDQVMRCLKHVSGELVVAAKKRTQQEFYTTIPDAEFYSTQYMTSPNYVISRNAQMRLVKAATATDVGALLRKIVDFNRAVCVYEGQRDVGLTWANMGL